MHGQTPFDISKSQPLQNESKKDRKKEWKNSRDKAHPSIADSANIPEGKLQVLGVARLLILHSQAYLRRKADDQHDGTILAKKRERGTIYEDPYTHRDSKERRMHSGAAD